MPESDLFLFWGLNMIMSPDIKGVHHMINNVTKNVDSEVFPLFKVNTREFMVDPFEVYSLTTVYLY